MPIDSSKGSGSTPTISPAATDPAPAQPGPAQEQTTFSGAPTDRFAQEKTDVPVQPEPGSPSTDREREAAPRPSGTAQDKYEIPVHSPPDETKSGTTVETESADRFAPTGAQPGVQDKFELPVLPNPTGYTGVGLAQLGLLDPALVATLLASVAAAEEATTTPTAKPKEVATTAGGGNGANVADGALASQSAAPSSTSGSAAGQATVTAATDVAGVAGVAATATPHLETRQTIREALQLIDATRQRYEGVLGDARSLASIVDARPLNAGERDALVRVVATARHDLQATMKQLAHLEKLLQAQGKQLTHHELHAAKGVLEAVRNELTGRIRTLERLMISLEMQQSRAGASDPIELRLIAALTAYLKATQAIVEQQLRVDLQSKQPSDQHLKDLQAAGLRLADRLQQVRALNEQWRWRLQRIPGSEEEEEEEQQRRRSQQAETDDGHAGEGQEIDSDLAPADD